MVFLVKNSTKKGAKIQNEYLFLLKCIMATSWIGNLYFRISIVSTYLLVLTQYVNVYPKKLLQGMYIVHSSFCL